MATTKIKKTIRINECTKEELVTLPGIGDVLANKIIKERSSKYFESSNDIINRVKGIGKTKMNTICAEFTIITKIVATHQKNNESKFDDSGNVNDSDNSDDLHEYNDSSDCVPVSDEFPNPIDYQQYIDIFKAIAKSPLFNHLNIPQIIQIISECALGRVEMCANSECRGEIFLLPHTFELHKENQGYWQQRQKMFKFLFCEVSDAFYCSKCSKHMRICGECHQLYHFTDCRDCTNCTNVITDCECYDRIHRCKTCDAVLCLECCDGGDSEYCRGCSLDHEFEHERAGYEDEEFAYH